MNLILIRAGYPQVAVRPEDWSENIRSLQQSQAGDGSAGFERLLYESLDATLTDYLSVLGETPAGATLFKDGSRR